MVRFLLIVLALFLLVWNSPEPKKKYIPVSSEVKKAMKMKHGTWYLICPEGEKCYFYRGSAKCRL